MEYLSKKEVEDVLGLSNAGESASNRWQIRNQEELVKLRERVKNVQPEVFAYLAGFYDGEGSLTVNGGKRYNPNGTITNRIPYVCIKFSHNHREPLDKYVEVFGGKVWESFKITKVDKTAGRYLYHYRANLIPTRVMLECLLPYLIIKRAQAELGLELFNKSDIIPYNEFREERIRLIVRIRSYNEKGKALISVDLGQ